MAPALRTKGVKRKREAERESERGAERGSGGGGRERWPRRWRWWRRKGLLIVKK